MLKIFGIYVVLFYITLNANAQLNFQDYPYSLSGNDYAWVGVGFASLGSAYIIANNTAPLSTDEIDALHADQINAFDRSGTQKWNTQIDNLSHIGKYALALSPAILMIAPFKDKAWQPFFTYGVMYFENALLTTGLTNLSKSLSQRIRPFYYNPSFSSSEKQDLGNSYGESDSFFSGHSAIAFSSAVFLSSTYTDIYGKSKWSKILWVGSLSIAAYTSYLRYESGQHFPTDLIAGAALGASIGWLIPYTHRNKNQKLGLMVAPNQFYLSYRF